MKKITKIIATVLSLCMVLALTTGCAQQSADTSFAQGGTLLVRVNPEIAVNYDENGKVTQVESRNADAQALLENYTDYTGKDTKTVVKELVTAIGDAGYFVEEVEGERKQIVIEIEKGSAVPNDKFIEEVVNEVKIAIKDNEWHSPVDLVNESDYGMTDYVDTDYGTDYDATDYNEPVSDYGTDYDDTDYGKTETPVTTPSGTDYGTDYNDTDYNEPVSDYGTDYADTDYSEPESDYGTDYDESDYGNSDYDDSDYT